MNPRRTPVSCQADPVRLSAWLRSPAPDGDGSVAEALGIGVDFDIYGFQRWQRITDLVVSAHAAGVFGVPDHTTEVLHLAGEHGFVDAHRIALTTPRGVVVCTQPVETIDLLTDHLSGVDAAVHLLTAVAGHVDQLLRQVHHWAKDGHAATRAFPPLTADCDVLPVTPAAAIAPATNTSRHR